MYYVCMYVCIMYVYIYIYIIYNNQTLLQNTNIIMMHELSTFQFKKPLEKWTTWKRIADKKYKIRKLQNTKHLKLTAATGAAVNKAILFRSKTLKYSTTCSTHLPQSRQNGCLFHTAISHQSHSNHFFLVVFSAPKCLNPRFCLSLPILFSSPQGPRSNVAVEKVREDQLDLSCRK